MYGVTYGALYNFYTVNTGNLCPAGWHVPTDAEWTTLIRYLGGSNVAGGKLKEASTVHWTGPNIATNESGFTALPGGLRSPQEGFDLIGDYGNWWSATESDASSAWYPYLYYCISDVYMFINDKNFGLSVRCVKDN